MCKYLTNVNKREVPVTDLHREHSDWQPGQPIADHRPASQGPISAAAAPTSAGWRWAGRISAPGSCPPCTSLPTTDGKTKHTHTDTRTGRVFEMLKN